MLPGFGLRHRGGAGDYVEFLGEESQQLRISFRAKRFGVRQRQLPL
jgi:hypothetical protein